MIEFEIDNKKISVAEGSMIIEAADNAGIYIPRFCYHKKLSIAANCRMCLVEVEKSKKPLPACATPVTPGMKVFTRSSMTLEAQRSVMEFLLINHPLDCPICDQGGECELQDVSLGYGSDVSRYTEPKRSVYDENLGPLIATDMTRCIQCTRCVRFGIEVAGMPELGATQRGENLEITTYVHHTMRSELSGNIIDLCPVGALTSKPYRFTARAWELKQQPSISPHDCMGSNINVHTRGYEYNDYRLVMRVVPRDNEPINETWISDRDRFSYEAIKSTDRLLTPKIKRDGQWIEVDWAAALNLVVHSLREIIATKGAGQIAALASPNSTVEEFFLLQKLMRSIGSNNLDHRIRTLDFSSQENYPSHPTLGIPFEDIEQQDVIVLIGSDIRREQPVGALRVRKAALRGAKIICINPIDYDFNFSVTTKAITPSKDIPRFLAGIAKALIGNKLSEENQQFFATIEPTKIEKSIAQCLKKTKKGLLVLGAHALQHPQATLIRTLVQMIASHRNLTFGCLSEGANAAGAWLAGMLPHRGPGGVAVENGLNAKEMLSKTLEAYLVLNIEPEMDCATSGQALNVLTEAPFVVVFTPFLNEQFEQYANVLLPIAPFFESNGTFVNACDQWQSFQSVTKPLGQARDAWKVLRVLGNLFELEGFDYLSCDQVLTDVKNSIAKMTSDGEHILQLPDQFEEPRIEGLTRVTQWPIYQIDNFVRRAKALQEWSLDENLMAIRINETVGKRYGIQTGEIISVVQNETQLDLPVVIDNRIAGDYVVVPGGLSATAGFGENMGPIDLMRGYSSD